MVTVVSDSNGIVPLHEMSDGNIAEVVASSVEDLKINTVIQRFKDAIILLGEGYGRSFPYLIKNSSENGCIVKVRILPKGTLIRL